MKRKRFTEEQIIGILRQADAGRKPDELAREHGMSVGTFYAWKAKFGGMDGSRLFKWCNKVIRRHQGYPAVFA